MSQRACMGMGMKDTTETPAVPVADGADQPLQAKAPRRSRGVKRVETLLAAAEQLFAEIGYGATSMNAIAQRAGAPVGSLYQFFPSKVAIGGALVDRYAADLQQAWREACMKVPRGNWPAFADGLIAATLECIGRHPAFATLDEAQAQVHLRPNSQGEFEVELMKLVAAAAGEEPDERHRLVAIVALQILKSAYALHRRGAGSLQDVRDEIALIMKSYFQAKFADA